MAKYFGTNGVRGTFDQLTPELALKLAGAIGTYFKKNDGRTKILVARDYRLTGELLKNAVLSGLASVGVEVVDLGEISSPTAELMIKQLNADALIIITASHNPPEWNALKVVDGKGIGISKERGEEIEKLLGKIKLTNWDRVGKITNYDRSISDHIEKIESNLNRTKLQKKKIILDCANGTASIIAPLMFRRLGAEIITINSHPDGRFPGRPSEPTEENVKDLIDAVIANKADAGIAWDGDGDRVIFVDEKGEYIIGDRVLALCVIWQRENQKGDLITTVATSRAATDAAENLGMRVRLTAIGAPYLSEEMSKNPGAIGGEEVGGVIWPQISLAKDGFFTAAKLYEALSKAPLSQWLAQIPKYENVKIKIKADRNEEKKKMVQNVINHAKKNKLKYSTIDGVRIDFPDSWVIVRASGTENYIRIFAEAKILQKAKDLTREYEKIAREKH
ncbi:phosphoglucosamine mutase [Candidatus Micrarchaeota archaeon]|nr:phosphoglucosamine mutase [Candidatus Micrarchaeota archaeon]